MPAQSAHRWFWDRDDDSGDGHWHTRYKAINNALDYWDMITLSLHREGNREIEKEMDREKQEGKWGSINIWKKTQPNMPTSRYKFIFYFFVYLLREKHTKLGGLLGAEQYSRFIGTEGGSRAFQQRCGSVGRSKSTEHQMKIKRPFHSCIELIHNTRHWRALRERDKVVKNWSSQRKDFVHICYSW